MATREPSTRADDNSAAIGQFHGQTMRRYRGRHITLREIRYQGPGTLPPHSHESVLVCLLVSGQHRHRLENDILEYAPFQAGFHPAQSVHRDEIGRSSRLFCFDLAPEFAHRIAHEYPAPPATATMCTPQAAMLALAGARHRLLTGWARTVADAAGGGAGSRRASGPSFTGVPPPFRTHPRRISEPNSYPGQLPATSRQLRALVPNCARRGVCRSKSLLPRVQILYRRDAGGIPPGPRVLPNCVRRELEGRRLFVEHLVGNSEEPGLRSTRRSCSFHFSNVTQIRSIGWSPVDLSSQKISGASTFAQSVYVRTAVSKSNGLT
jgi:hypothetical protein